jgi:WD40 repeat protein
MAKVCRFYPVASCNESSGSVITMAIDHRQIGDKATCIVGAAASSDHQYNRPGELAILQTSDSGLNCVILDGHRSFLADESAKRQTVTCSAFHSPFRWFATGGYDGTVCIWDSETFALVARFG